MGRRVLVTGGSRGIGAATAKAFASAGYDVLVHYHLSREQAEEVVAVCRSFGVACAGVQADLRTLEGVESLFAQAGDLGFLPDVLVNNAGIPHVKLFQGITPEEWDEVVGLHLKASFFCAQKVLPHMIRQRFGRIINLSSVWGERGAAMESLYSMVKGGINAWTKALAKEVASTGVTVNAVAPGAIHTEMNAFLAPGEEEALLAEIPAQRWGTPEEVAALILFLASDAAAYITGQVISPNGGWF